MAPLQQSLWISTIVTEVVLLGIVSMRGLARNSPAFVVYIYWSVLGDLGTLVCYRDFPDAYLGCCLAQSAGEGLILVLVLLDLTRLALRPLPAMVSRGVLGVFSFITAGAGAILWKFSDSWALWAKYPGYHIYLREQPPDSLLRVLLLLLIGFLVQFLGAHSLPIGWRETDLQVATGMGIYALASLAEALATTYQRFLAQTVFFSISLGVGVIYEFCLIYWIVCFLRLDRGAADQPSPAAPEDSAAGPYTLWTKDPLVTGETYRVDTV